MTFDWHHPVPVGSRVVITTVTGERISFTVGYSGATWFAPTMSEVGELSLALDMGHLDGATIQVM